MFFFHVERHILTLNRGGSFSFWPPIFFFEKFGWCKTKKQTLVNASKRNNRRKVKSLSFVVFDKSATKKQPVSVYPIYFLQYTNIPLQLTNNVSLKDASKIIFLQKVHLHHHPLSWWTKRTYCTRKQNTKSLTRKGKSKQSKKMRVSPTVLASLLLTDFVEAFQPVLYQGTYRPYSKLKSRKDLHEFDHLFAEKTTSDTQKTSQPVVSRRRIHVNDERRTVFASSATMDATSEFDVESESAAARTEGTAVGSGQSSTEELFNPQKALLEMEREEKGASFGERMADEFFEMNFLGAVSSLLIPGILAFVGGRWMYNRISARLSGSLTAGLEEFADEMIYHDGDFEEMKLCYSDYSKKLSVLGPLKGQKMSKKYLELYAKKKTISPQAIRFVPFIFCLVSCSSCCYLFLWFPICCCWLLSLSWKKIEDLTTPFPSLDGFFSFFLFLSFFFRSSLSYVFSLFKLSEDKAADLLVSLCQDLGEDKISSVGKLLFFGSRILKSPEAKAALSPIKDMIKATYPDVSMADTMVDSSQQ